MKFIFPVLALTSSLSALAAEPKTLYCEASYSYLDANGAYLVDSTVKNFSAKLKAKEFYFGGGKTITTENGRFEISMSAVEPYEKERREIGHKRFTTITVTDKRTNTLTVAGDYKIEPRTKDEDAVRLVLMPESDDNKPANAMNISCELK